MSDELQRNNLRITAALEGEAVSVANIGKKITVSTMELVCLVNLAEVGVLSLLANVEGETGANVFEELGKHLERIDAQFESGGRTGVDRLTQSTVALLRSVKFGLYLASESNGE